MRSISLLFVPALATCLVKASRSQRVFYSDCTPGIMSTPTFGNGSVAEPAVFTVCASTLIAAPPRAIYDILIDFESYPFWNSFVLKVIPTSSPFPAVGASMNFTVARLFPGNTSSSEIITVLNAKYTTAVWRDNSATPGLLDAEHISEVLHVRDGVSRYVSWETYYGAEAVAIQALLSQQLQNAFAAQGDDLKTRAEAGYGNL